VSSHSSQGKQRQESGFRREQDPAIVDFVEGREERGSFSPDTDEADLVIHASEADYLPGSEDGEVNPPVDESGSGWLPRPVQ